MSYQLIKNLERDHWVKLSGRLTVRDFQELQALAGSSLEHTGQFRVLVELDGFQGWSNENGWENTSFLDDDGAGLSKLAFVGDENNVCRSLLQAAAFVAVALLLGTELPLLGWQTFHLLLAAAGSALMLGALGLLLSVNIKQLENFAGTMNFVIFPMYFMSTALYPLWKLEESGATWVWWLARVNPFTHAVEWMRFALYGKDPGIAPWVVLGCLVAFFAVACVGYDPQRGFGGLTKRG